MGLLQRRLCSNKDILVGLNMICLVQEEEIKAQTKLPQRSINPSKTKSGRSEDACACEPLGGLEGGATPDTPWQTSTSTPVRNEVVISAMQCVYFVMESFGNNELHLNLEVIARLGSTSFAAEKIKTIYN